MVRTYCDKCQGQDEVRPVYLEVPRSKDPWSVRIGKDLCAGCRIHLYKALQEYGFNVTAYQSVI